MQCTAIAVSSGKQCRMHCLRGEDKCLIHSDSERAKYERTKIKLLSKAQMVQELQKQLRSVRDSENVDPLEKSREIRAIILQINELVPEENGERPTAMTQEKGDVLKFEKRVKRSMEDKENAK